ncbi:hypothetical protein F2Q69_00034515 [Brassica cretica]|uniref:Uncharacterized protein n=1 Tax=Brassica cretica TaxID=69181 RepID=A0A8S9STL4_BRACR|nr:hypothetical protein F2Q69_00034515 [Brassica cretica]
MQRGLNHAGTLTRVDSLRRGNEGLRCGLDHAGWAHRAHEDGASSTGSRGMSDAGSRTRAHEDGAQRDDSRRVGLTRGVVPARMMKLLDTPTRGEGLGMIYPRA